MKNREIFDKNFENIILNWNKQLIQRYIKLRKTLFVRENSNDSLFVKNIRIVTNKKSQFKLKNKIYLHVSEQKTYK